MSDNGHNNRPFRQQVNAEVPIIGQPCDIKAWFVTVVLSCRCGAHESILIAGKVGASGQCPACRKVFVVQGMSSAPGSEHVNFNIGIGIAAADPAGAQEPH